MNLLNRLNEVKRAGVVQPFVRRRKGVKEDLCMGLIEATKADEFLNAIAAGIGNIGLGYYFSSESVDREGMMVLEFSSLKGPKIFVKINKEQFDKFSTGEYRADDG